MSAEDVMPLPLDTTASAEGFVDALDVLAKRMSSTQVASATPGAVPGWVGKAADAYTNEIVELHTRVGRLIDTVPPVKKAVGDWASALRRAIDVTVPAFHQEYESAQAFLAQQKHALNAKKDDLSADAYDAELHAITANYDNRVEDIVGRYKRSMIELDAVAQDAATKIRATIDAYIPPEVVKRGRDAIGAELFNGMPLVDGQAEWEYAQKEAIEAATLIGDGDATPDKIRKFHERFGDMCDSPFFANALVEKVSPQKLMRFSISMDVFHNKGQGARDFDKVLNETAKHIGNLFVLSTGGMNLADGGQTQTSFEVVKEALMGRDGSSIDQLTKKHIEQWKAVGNTFYDLIGEPLANADAQGSHFGHYGYEYLGAMLNQVAQDNENLALGPAFMTGEGSIAHDMLRWDHETLKHLAQLSDYGSWNHSTYGDRHNLLDPVQGMLKLMDQPAALTDGSIDLKALQRNHELSELINDRFDAVQRFMVDDTTFSIDASDIPKRASSLFQPPQGPMNIARYLTGFRNNDDYPASADQGEALGRVLAQGSAVGSPPPPDVPDGSVEYERWKTRHKRSTAIALNFLEGYQDGLDIDWNDDEGENYFGARNSNLRSWAGEILAPHVDDLAAAIWSPANQETGLLTPRRGDWDLVVDTNLRNRLISRGGFFTDISLDVAKVNDAGTPDDPRDDFYERGRMAAADRLLGAAQSAYRREVGAAYLAEDPEKMSNTLHRWGALMNPLLVAPEEAEDIHLNAINERNEQVRKILDSGLSFFDVEGAISKVPGGVVLSEAFKAGKEPALEAFLPTGLNNAVGIAQGHEKAETLMGRGYVEALSDDSGFLQKHPEVLHAMRNHLMEEGSSIPGWLEDTNVPMPRIEQMSPEERRVFRLYVTQDERISYEYNVANEYSPDHAQQSQEEANQLLNKNSRTNGK